MKQKANDLTVDDLTSREISAIIEATGITEADIKRINISDGSGQIMTLHNHRKVSLPREVWLIRES